MNNNEKMKAQAELCAKLNQLKATDYKVLKHLDGELTATEYKPIKELRASLRQDIRALEGIINGGIE